MFALRNQRDSLAPEQVAAIPWPLCQQYEMVHFWMDQDDPVYARLQLRDTSETLVKLLCILFLARDIRAIQNGEHIADDSPIFEFLNEGGFSLGTWNEKILMKYKKSRSNPIVEMFLSTTPHDWTKGNPFLPLIKHRNDLSHGILAQERSQDYDIAQGWLMELDKCLTHLLPFFKKITLFTQNPVEPATAWTCSNFPFVQEAKYPFHTHETESETRNIIYPVYMEIQGQTLATQARESGEPAPSPDGQAQPGTPTSLLQAERFSLSPILSVQPCRTCGKLSTFFLHEYRPSKTKTKAKFLEFLVNGLPEEPKEELFLQKLRHLAPASLVFKKLENIILPEAAQDDDDIVPVDYLVQQVQAYVDQHEQGMISLQGPGGIGKSYFCKSLGKNLKKSKAMYVPLQAHANTSIAALLSYIETMSKKRKERWTFDSDAIDLRQSATLVPQVLAKLKENCPTLKLVLVLDGWDELAEDSDLLNYLPCKPQDLPKGCFVLISYRPKMKAKAEMLLHDMFPPCSDALRLEIQPQDMVPTLRNYIDKKHDLAQFTETILEKSQNIFLYVYHYCDLLTRKVFDSQNFPDKKDIYTVFFQLLCARVGQKLYDKVYVPILSILAVAKEPVSLEQLSYWGIQEADAEIVVQDIPHLLERDTSQSHITYSIRHKDILEFFQEQEEWRKQCQKQEEAILGYTKKVLQGLLQAEETEWHAQSLYALEHAVDHWCNLAARDLLATEQIYTWTDLEQHILSCMKNAGNNFPDIGEAYHQLGRGCSEKALYDKAVEYLQKALEIRLSKLGSDHLDVAVTYGNMANVYYSQGKYDKALEYLQKALDIRLPKLGSDHTSVATTYNNMAAVYYSQDQYDKALEYHQKALDIRLSKLGSDHPDVAQTYLNMANVYHSQGQYGKALEYYQKTLEIFLPQLGSDHPSVAITYNNMAVVYRSQGQHDKALEYHQKALEMQLAKLGSDHPSVATTYNNMAVVYHSQGQYDNALEYHQKALQIRLSKLGSNHPDVVNTYWNIANAYYSQGQDDKGNEYFLKTLGLPL